MNKFQSAISLSIIVGVTAAAWAQQPDGTANVRRLKYPPQSAATAPAPRPKMFIPEPIPAPQVEGQAPASNHLAVPEPMPGGEQLSPEPSPKGTAPCPTTANCPRPACRRTGWLRSLCGGHHDITPEMPFGASMNAAMKTQVCNALAAQLVLYRYDFCDGAPCDVYKLNVHGEKRLAELAWRMQSCGMHPLVVESTPENPALETARRDYVVKMLREANVALPDDWVVVGDSSVRAMSTSQMGVVERRMHKELTSPSDEKSAQEVDSVGTSGGMGGAQGGGGGGQGGAGGGQGGQGQGGGGNQ